MGVGPEEATPVQDAYWRFASERHRVYLRRLAGSPPPWTQDPVIGAFRFTNTFRAADRVSQYLIKEVIYQSDLSPEDTIFRILLYKLFNRVSTWRLLQAALGPISWSGYRFDRYETVLSDALRDGNRIYSGAYIMPPAGKAAKKHIGHLRLLERLMSEGLTPRLARTRSLRELFELLLSYPGIGPFLAYQYSVDLNYSELIDFPEDEFVVPGPGAKDGISKCFPGLSLTEYETVIHRAHAQQEEEFAVRGITPVSLWGRRLQLIDCQNLFCEVGKYSRATHPQVRGSGRRTRIKQRYRLEEPLSPPWFPPKWGLNQAVQEWMVKRAAI